MTHIQNIKNKLIDRIMASNNESLLHSIDGIFSSVNENESVSFTPEQFEMLYISDNDIEKGNIISQEELDRQDQKWMQ